MSPLFADTGYWIALISETDMLRERAISVTRQMASRQIVTSEMVLTEVLNEFGSRGRHFRMAAATFVSEMQAQGIVRVIAQTHELFVAALDLYTDRPDKQWSLTDCASMVICRQEGIQEVLAHDRRFRQAGLVPLLRAPGE